MRAPFIKPNWTSAFAGVTKVLFTKSVFHNTARHARASGHPDWLAVFAVLSLLAACENPAPVFKPVTVDVPIETPCKTEVPTPPAPSQPPASASLFDKARALLIELDQRKAYEAQLEAALKACE